MATTGNASGLIDTDILIDAGRGLAAAVTFLSTQRSAGGIHLSIISSMELVQGYKNGAAITRVQQFLRQTTVLPISVPISQAAYLLMETFFLSHGLLIPDALIAATALVHNLTLYTKNRRHFQMIPALTLGVPY